MCAKKDLKDIKSMLTKLCTYSRYHFVLDMTYCTTQDMLRISSDLQALVTFTTKSVIYGLIYELTIVI